ncbi:MAG TPA: DEAD/DEAH box helicase [Gemmatimonadaceae bacterium]|nr:DEAD/DEAH box helicase [Gemmatimonadaceae bacterium]
MGHTGEEGERGRDGVTRNQNVFYILPHDAAAITHFLAPALQRLTPESAEAQLLVITPDDETAVAVAEAATRLPAGVVARVLPVTARQRATRLLKARPAAVVVGTPSELLDLIRSSAIKLDRVRQVIVAWGDAILDGGAGEPLEAVLAEVPKEAARTVITSHATPSVEALVERHAWRARRAGVITSGDGEAVDLRYVAVAPQGRASALRRVLDDLDPERCAVFVRSDEAEREVRAAVRALGLGEIGDGPGVIITRGESVPNASMVMLYESPLSRETLKALVAPGAPVVALATPRQLPVLRALAAGGRLTPLTLSGPTARARTREDRTREELRATLASGVPARELLTLEPLLAEYDGVELAAAALRLLDRERERVRLHEPAERAAEPTAESGRADLKIVRAGERPAVARIYLNVGARDGATARDVVGAVANEAGIPGAQIGRVELRDTHTLVEIPATEAEAAVKRLAGITIRGRRVAARVDQDRPRGVPRSDRRDTKDRPRPRRGSGAPRSRRPRSE